MCLQRGASVMSGKGNQILCGIQNKNANSLSAYREERAPPQSKWKPDSLPLSEQKCE